MLGPIRIEAGPPAPADGTGYAAPTGTTATRVDAPLEDLPPSIQFVPAPVIRDQGAVRLEEVVRNVSGGTHDQFIIRGFDATLNLRDGLRTTRTS